jgi:hypothetical protein
MGANQVIPKPPPGFEIDLPTPPKGFVLDRPAAPEAKRPGFFAGIPATDPFTQLAITPDVARTALSVFDIAAGGPLVRGLLNLAPTVPEFAGTGREIPTATTRNLLTDIGRSTGKVGFGGFLPEAPTVEYRITPELGAKALPAAAEFALYPAVWRFAGKSVEEIYSALRPWYIRERGLTPTGAALKAYIEANRLNKIDTLARETTGGEQQAAFAAWERITGKRHPADTRPPFAPTEPFTMREPTAPAEPAKALPAGQGFELVEPAPVVRVRRQLLMIAHIEPFDDRLNRATP